ncbi:hypothetical protein D9756_006765 [Leucocoprinus leucothites]|uniref:Inositol oxygenase n=1 Tax=Leucocoprinus leucothites TaxID=201217 RepID=A0A8H5LGH5_9AGAR|nr:hypothetical protein D9756_006765 [Leucoagaricus leucothites]
MPILSEEITCRGVELEEVSDAIDEGRLLLNVLKGKLWSNKSEFDETKDKSTFRDYEGACDRVKNFYREQHIKQTVEFNLKAHAAFKERKRVSMSVWEAMELLNTLVDESDPDTNLSQIEHLLQTAEAIRRDGKPEWMQVTGLVHDLGKLLLIFGSQGQWDVVGDTFVVGCEFSDKCIYPETFGENPDANHPVYSTKYGIYEPNCGLDNVMLSWGHDEYLYHVLKDQCTLPAEGLAMIRDAFREMLQSVAKNGHTFDECKQVLHDNIKLDPGFKEFYAWSKTADIPVIIVSSGMEPLIRAVLSNLVGEQANEIEIISNHVTVESDGKWEIKYRHPTSGFGHDKSQAILHYRNLPQPPTLFFFGDGVSDISAAKHADLLFVKSKPGGDNDLASYCKREGIKHVLFEDFKDALVIVRDIVDGKKTIAEVISAN